jgi:hypothetical protein
VLRYLRHFTQTIQLHTKGSEPGQIRIITGFSDKLIAEYLELYRHYQHAERLKHLLHPQPNTQKNRS